LCDRGSGRAAPALEIEVAGRNPGLKERAALDRVRGKATTPHPGKKITPLAKTP